mgnify:FL=1
MRAIVYHKYGGTEQLKMAEVPIPVPKPDQVRIKVEAASVNSWDWDQLIGKPFVIRLIGGLFRPTKSILGFDIAGVIDEVGAEVDGLQVGDEVFGDISEYGWGAFGEYLCVSPKPLARKATNLSFSEVAAIPHAGVLALQGLRQGRGLKAGDHLLINGAGGGVGTLGLQLAKDMGAKVTVVDRADKLAMLKQLGADEVLDYQTTDYTHTGPYDFILDNVARRSMADYRRALSANGVFVMIGGDMRLVLGLAIRGIRKAKPGSKKLQILAHKPSAKDLEHLQELVTSDTLKPIIDQEYSLIDVPKALDRIGSGEVRGKLIIKPGK